MQRPMHRLACWLALTIAAALPATAAELGQGDFELGLSALLQDTEASGFYLNLSTRVGYMITRNHEAGPLVSLIYVNPDEGESFTGASLGAFYRYNFGTTGKYNVPFLGLSATGYTGGLADQLEWSWQAESGVRIMPSPLVSINTVLFWHRDYPKVDWILSERYFGVSIGVSLFL